MENVNRQILLASRPTGFPQPSNFQLSESPVPTASDGEFVVRIHYLSVDPYMRGRMNDAKSYAPPVEIGAAMTGGAVGRVVESKTSRFGVGDYVVGDFGWQEYARSAGDGVRKVDPALAPISTSLGILGMTGLTAYFGLLDICHPQPGETGVVSGAAGAVGSTVGQIAKLKGCRAVGIAGSDAKVGYITEELGFDDAFNYRTEPDYLRALQKRCPNGVDAYFDNVGGAITDAVFPLLNVKARVSICGQISQYNLTEPELGPRLFWHLIRKQAKVEGFLIFQLADRFQDALTEMAGWVQAGRIKYRETVVDGLENAPAAFIGMLKGANVGKQLVRLVAE